MNSKLVLNQFAFHRQYLSMLVDDIPDDQLTAQPGGIVNHPAWQLGHLAFVSDRFATMLGQLHLIRAFEETVLEFAGDGLVHGPAHSSIGQEGGAVGSIV